MKVFAKFHIFNDVTIFRTQEHNNLKSLNCSKGDSLSYLTKGAWMVFFHVVFAGLKPLARLNKIGHSYEQRIT
jgi:hypothetical protein